jgi:hypothetical protein
MVAGGWASVVDKVTQGHCNHRPRVWEPDTGAACDLLQLVALSTYQEWSVLWNLHFGGEVGQIISDQHPKSTKVKYIGT